MQLPRQWEAAKVKEATKAADAAKIAANATKITAMAKAAGVVTTEALKAIEVARAGAKAEDATVRKCKCYENHN